MLVARRFSDDRFRINAGDESDLTYWAASFGITKERLLEVVGKVGESVKAIREEIRRTPKD